MDPLIERIKNFVGGDALPPVKPMQIQMVEKTLGFNLPLLLKELYTEVGNGGFGPGEGILSIGTGWREDGMSSADRLYVPHRNRKYLFPICYFGGASYALLDCKVEEGRVFWSDEGTVHKEPLASSLREWLEEWVENASNLSIEMNKWLERNKQ